MKLTLTKFTDTATWEDGLLSGSTSLADELYAVPFEITPLTATGPNVYPNPTNELGIRAAAIHAEVMVSPSPEYPVTLGADDGPNTPVLIKHYGPGPHPGTGTPQEVHSATEPDNPLYHGTPRSSLTDIARHGLQSNLRERNDFGERPGEDYDSPQEQDLLYFTRAEDSGWNKEVSRLSDEVVLLRFDGDALPPGIGWDEDALRPDEFYLFSDGAFEIPPENIQYRDDDGIWRPLTSLINKHYGPGPHPGTGTEQTVHGAAFLGVGTGETVDRDVILDDEGNPAPLGMESLPPDIQAKVLATAKAYGRTPEQIRENVDMVFESAADRYESMDADQSWHDDDDLPEWIKDREYAAYRDTLVETREGEWRWAKDAGTKLRDIDRFYASHHEDLYALSIERDQPFGEVVGYHAAVSPGLRAPENLRFSELATQYWDENPKFTAEEADYINGFLKSDQEKIVAKGGWREERIAPQLDFEVEAGKSYRSVMKAAEPEAMARIMYRKQLFEGNSLSLGRGYTQHATGLKILYEDLDVDATLSGPKVRSFYNNIIWPDAGRDDITVDFQTLDAAWNGHGSNDTAGTEFTTTPRYKGVPLGVRPLVASIVRESGASYSDRIEFDNAAEMQEVLWAEWKRGTPTSGNGRSKRYGEGKWGLEEIRKIS